MHKLRRVASATRFLRAQLPFANRSLVRDHPLALEIGDRLVDALLSGEASRDDLLEAEAILEHTFETRRRVPRPGGY